MGIKIAKNGKQSFSLVLLFIFMLKVADWFFCDKQEKGVFTFSCIFLQLRTSCCDYLLLVIVQPPKHQCFIYTLLLERLFVTLSSFRGFYSL